MKTLLAHGIALIALAVSAPATAANLPVKARPAAPAAPVISWTGCYLGVDAGINSGQSQHFAPDVGGTAITPKFDLSGFGLVGGTVGCSYQVAPQVVIGAEGDFSATDKAGTARDLGSFFNTNFEQETKERWFATARGRLGFTPGPDWLLYVTGGVAFAKFDVDEFNTTAPVFGASDSATLTGWTVGGGAEWKFSIWNQVSFKVEWLFADFGTHSFLNPPITPGNCSCFRSNVKTTDQILRFGLNWHLF
jgi:outer membrane immunogenic protein